MPLQSSHGSAARPDPADAIADQNCAAPVCDECDRPAEAGVHIVFDGEDIVVCLSCLERLERVKRAAINSLDV